MIGAIIGDIIGSRFEFSNHRSKRFKLFASGCDFTDDTVMTLAVAKALMEARKKGGRLEPYVIKWLRKLGNDHPRRGYGGAFKYWLTHDDPEPYYSFGNGAAMRVSAVGEFARDVYEAIAFSRAATQVTHDHPEGLKGAEAVAVLIHEAKIGASREEIKDAASLYYPLDFTISKIRPTYEFNESCQGTVPVAIEAFLESKSFEDAIRIAISVGGDSDTLACITGSIAEAFYGVPDNLKEQALWYLDNDLRAIYDEWEDFLKL